MGQLRPTFFCSCLWCFHYSELWGSPISQTRFLQVDQLSLGHSYVCNTIYVLNTYSYSVPLRECSSNEAFKKNLKTYMFSEEQIYLKLSTDDIWNFLVCFLQAQWACCCSVDVFVFFESSSSPSLPLTWLKRNLKQVCMYAAFLQKESVMSSLWFIFLWTASICFVKAIYLLHICYTFAGGKNVAFSQRKNKFCK